MWAEQILQEPDKNLEMFQQLRKLSSEDCIFVEGVVQLRYNPNLKKATGKWGALTLEEVKALYGLFCLLPAAWLCLLIGQQETLCRSPKLNPNCEKKYFRQVNAKQLADAKWRESITTQSARHSYPGILWTRILSVLYRTHGRYHSWAAILSCKVKKPISLHNADDTKMKQHLQ